MVCPQFSSPNFLQFSLAIFPAFTETGGLAKLVMVPSFKDNGRYLFGDPAGIPIWTNYVDKFLAEIGIEVN